MRELFDARLNLDDRPMTPEQLIDAVRMADMLVSTVTDEINEGSSETARRQGEADRPVRQRRRQHRRRGGARARHYRHQHAQGSHRGHRRHDHGADPGRAAPADRGLDCAVRRQRLAGLVADLDAGPPHRRQAARHHRHGPDRPSGGATRARLRPANPLSQSKAGRAEHRGRAGRNLLGKRSTRCWRGWTSSR